MLTDQKFWIGVVAGFALYWAWKNWMGRKATGG